jgi:hypothetical protein
VILDELGYLPFSASGGALLFHLLSKLCQRPARADLWLDGKCGNFKSKQRDAKANALLRPENLGLCVSFAIDMAAPVS